MKLNADNQPASVEGEGKQPVGVGNSVQKTTEPTEGKVRYRASRRDSKQAIVLSGKRDSTVELIRKAVKQIGKDAFFGRFTPEEKRLLADVAYSYKRRGMRTSENEIARIAVNLIITDYQENRENSVLEQVLKALKE